MKTKLFAKALVVLALTIAAVANIRPAQAQNWQPYPLTGSETTMKIYRNGYQEVFVKIKVKFPNYCYRITFPQFPSQQFNDPTRYYITAQAERNVGGVCSQVLQEVVQTYPLGVLNSSTVYNFTFYQNVSPTTVKTQSFRPMDLPYN